MTYINISSAETLSMLQESDAASLISHKTTDEKIKLIFDYLNSIAKSFGFLYDERAAIEYLTEIRDKELKKPRKTFTLCR